MKLLALETATDACSCALYVDGDLSQRAVLAPRKHAELILPMAEQLLAEAHLSPQQLDGVTFGQGPGSFTGVRIACSVAQGIAFAANIPVAPVSSLAALAQHLYETQGHRQVCVAFDARMREVYWGIYQLNQHGLMQLCGEESVGAAHQVPLPPTPTLWYGVGSGWAAYPDVLSDRLAGYLQGYETTTYPDATALIPFALAMFAHQQVYRAETVTPVYIRNKIV
jgi:tRNA threonylcarbamoyladenosine biosynthesis protein TsaB